MKNKLLVEVDTEGKTNVQILKPEGTPMPQSRDEWRRVVLLDIGTLCEGIIALMHLAEREGFQSSPDTLRMCIAHLKNGFADAGCVAYSPVMGDNKQGQ